MLRQYTGVDKANVCPHARNASLRSMVGDVELRERRFGVQRQAGFQKKRGQIAGFKIKSKSKTAESRRGNPSSPAFAPNTAYKETH
jgi:hypothetical protein